MQVPVYYSTILYTVIYYTVALLYSIALSGTCSATLYLEGTWYHNIRRYLVPGNKKTGTVYDAVPYVPRKVEERILGIDISAESIDIARKSHSGFCFDVIDALSVQGLEAIKNLSDKTLGGPPTVVAIDINGVREVEAVQKCIRNAMTLGPRLIIVKSRNLYPLL